MKMKEVTEEEILIIESKEDAVEFKKMASGRKFCKKGERLVDICDEEIARYNYNHNTGFFIRLFKRKKFKAPKEQLLLENRTMSVIRAVAAKIIRESNEEISREEIVKQVKEFIIDKYNEYEKTLAA